MAKNHRNISVNDFDLFWTTFELEIAKDYIFELKEKLEAVEKLLNTWEHSYQEHCGNSSLISTGKQTQLLLCVHALKKILTDNKDE